MIPDQKRSRAPELYFRVRAQQSTTWRVQHPLNPIYQFQPLRHIFRQSIPRARVLATQLQPSHHSNHQNQKLACSQTTGYNLPNPHQPHGISTSMPYKKGQSGNPGGIPKGTPEAREHARTLVPLAFAALKKALNRPGERVPAAIVILDSALGKVPNSVNLRVIKHISDMTDDELRAIAGETQEAMTIEHEASSGASSVSLDAADDA